MQTLPLTDLQQNGLYNFKILIDDWVNVHNPVCKPRRVRFMQVDEQVWKMETRIETRHWHQDIEMKILASDITAAGVSLEECEGLFKKFKRYLEYEYAQAFYEDNYIQIFERDFATIVRQKRQKPELCRFCKRSASQVTFKSRAHAIPNSIGNTAIFCVDECDDCNQLFGSTIENDFGNWSSLHRTIAQISGKTGPPKFKTKKGSRIETIDSVITVTSAKDQEIIEIDETNNRVKVTVELPFAPVGVYKTFCKIALSLLPKNDLVAYADLCNWIRGSVEFPDPRCIISQTCLSGRLVNPGRATIFRKKDSASGLPKCPSHLRRGCSSNAMVVS